MLTFIANWKMHLRQVEALNYPQALFQERPIGRIILAPPAPWLTGLAATPHYKQGHFLLAGQNCHWQEQGAFTGEIAPGMLKEAGAAAVLLGHSERRSHFGETEELTVRKIKAAVTAGLIPVCCIGESSGQQADEIVSSQLQAIMTVCGSCEPAPVIAYEPRWAIGSGRTPELPGLQHVLHVIRRNLGGRVWPVLYGGSTSVENAGRLASLSALDGLLVGGASLQPAQFAALTRNFAAAR